MNSAAPPAGRGVGDQDEPSSSSRTKNVSPDGSLTVSLLHGVNRWRWLFANHVKLAPLSVTSVPKCGLAMTFDQGIGGRRDCETVIAYVLPSSSKPPDRKSVG